MNYPYPAGSDSGCTHTTQQIERTSGQCFVFHDNIAGNMICNYDTVSFEQYSTRDCSGNPDSRSTMKCGDCIDWGNNVWTKVECMSSDSAGANRNGTLSLAFNETTL